MEENIFPKPAVAGLLKSSYVESRLHTDGEKNIERIRELQDQLTGSVATPYYVLVDPETGEAKGVFERATRDADEFRAFLERGL